MNKLYLLLPVVEGDNDDILNLLLKKADFYSCNEAFDYLKKIYELVDALNYENYEGIYDERQYSAIMKIIQGDKELQSQSPSPTNILRVFNDWFDFHDDKYEHVEHLEKKDADAYLRGYKDVRIVGKVYDKEHVLLLHDNQQVSDTIFNAYMQNENDGSVALLNQDASLYNEADLQNAISGDKVIPLMLLPVNFKTLHRWFAQNRNPQRQFDENYEKHGEKSKLGKRGYISPLTYTKEEIEPFLHKAIGVKDHKDRNLFFFDKNKNVYLYFWDENTPGQLFHAYEVKPENVAEINKIRKKGGRQLKDLVDEIGKE